MKIEFDDAANLQPTSKSMSIYKYQNYINCVPTNYEKIIVETKLGYVFLNQIMVSFHGN